MPLKPKLHLVIVFSSVSHIGGILNNWRPEVAQNPNTIILVLAYTLSPLVRFKVIEKFQNGFHRVGEEFLFPTRPRSTRSNHVLDVFGPLIV